MNFLEEFIKKESSALTILIIMNRLGVTKKAAYIIVGVVLWVSVLKSGVHATLAGVDLRNVSLYQMTTGVPLGIMAGLFLGKQIGVFGFSWVAIKLGLAKIPDNSTWLQLYGVSILTGIGFTMSLFVNSLAITDGNLYQQADKLAVLIASFSAGIAGYLILCVAKYND